MVKKRIERFFKFLPSLQFAVVNLVHLAFLSAIGTFLESYYDHNLSRLLVYNSIWMKTALCLLSINLMAVLVDRWPWEKKHAGFVMAHFGILILIAGSFITQVKGVDGSLRVAIGEKSRSITLPSELIAVYSSFDGKEMAEIYRDEPVFLFQQPKENKPYLIPLGNDSMEIISYYPYATSRVIYKPNEKGGVAIRFRLSGERANIVDWIYKKDIQSFVKKKVGLAHIVIDSEEYSSDEKNELILIPKNNRTLSYILKSKGKIKAKGKIKKGENIQTGWMDLKFHLIDFYNASQVYEFDSQKKPSDQTTSAIQVRLGDQKRWMGMNSFLSFYKKDRAYILGYMNQKHSIGGEIQLHDFRIKRYPGSMKAKEYESLVSIDGSEQITISMNQPLKYKEWTFYQSSFEEDDQGQVQASIFSVNKDPGRFIKYFGSFLIVAGIFALFYFRKNSL